MNWRRIALLFLMIAVLAPSMLQALVWTTVNFFFALCVLLAFYTLSRIDAVPKWFLTTACSVLLAIPPYPNWMWPEEGIGWTFHLGYKLVHFSEFALQFLAFILFFQVMFYCMLRILVRKPVEHNR